MAEVVAGCLCLGLTIFLPTFFACTFPEVLTIRNTHEVIGLVTDYQHDVSRCCDQINCGCAASCSQDSCSSTLSAYLAMDISADNSTTCCDGQCCRQTCCETCSEVVCTSGYYGDRDCRTEYYDCNCWCCDYGEDKCDIECGACWSYSVTFAYEWEYTPYENTDTLICGRDDYACHHQTWNSYQIDTEVVVWVDERNPSQAGLIEPTYNVVCWVFVGIGACYMCPAALILLAVILYGVGVGLLLCGCVCVELIKQCCEACSNCLHDVTHPREISIRKHDQEARGLNNSSIGLGFKVTQDASRAIERVRTLEAYVTTNLTQKNGMMPVKPEPEPMELQDNTYQKPPIPESDMNSGYVASAPSPAQDTDQYADPPPPY